ncbi:glycosyltransferase family 2 protein [Photobacterium damselae]|uniref:glycosyltransferase family 2 protein n=1 Tax=Photobacterium damselae TaxID=38293 RepID=UPI00165E7411|nr:glycosyltransferase family 2 protein [Photobacterium damselae]
MKYEITVIIPTINRFDCLLNTLKDLEHQKDVFFEVIIVDQSTEIPSDFFEKITSFNYDIRFYTQKELSASKARNVGLLKSKSDIVLFFDDDVIIKTPYLLKNHLLNYRDKDIDGVFGQILLTDEKVLNVRPKKSYNKKYGWLFFPSNYTARVIQEGIGMAGNLSVKKEACINSGGMDQNFVKGAYREESDFIQRFWSNNYKIVFDPEASLIHIGHKSGGVRNWGASRGLCAHHHVIGEWYFILKHGVKTNLFMNIYALLRRQIFNRININHPLNIPKSMFRSFICLYQAIKLLKNKKDLNDESTLCNVFVDVELIYEKYINNK